MTSSLTWLDHSDKERRRVLDAIDWFKETDTRDELGLASIRQDDLVRYLVGRVPEDPLEENIADARLELSPPRSSGSLGG